MSEEIGVANRMDEELGRRIEEVTATDAGEKVFVKAVVNILLRCREGKPPINVLRSACREAEREIGGHRQECSACSSTRLEWRCLDCGKTGDRGGEMGGQGNELMRVEVTGVVTSTICYVCDNEIGVGMARHADEEGTRHVTGSPACRRTP